MATALMKRFRRPSWMMPFGHEGFGDVFFDRLWPEWHRDWGEEWAPSMDFYEKDGKYHLTAEVPGMDKEDISISIEKGYLTISGKKEYEKEDKDADFYMKERRVGSFCRSFRIPGEVDDTKVDASYKDGILTLVMPHKEASEIKKIKVH